MKITFIGDPRGRERDRAMMHKGSLDPASIDLFGVHFPLGEPVSVPDDSEWVERFGGKIRGNSHFLVEEGTKQPGKSTEKVTERREGAETHHQTSDAKPSPMALIDTEERREEIAALRVELKSLGGAPDLRWGPKRLRSEIKKRRG